MSTNDQHAVDAAFERLKSLDEVTVLDVRVSMLGELLDDAPLVEAVLMRVLADPS